MTRHIVFLILLVVLVVIGMNAVRAGYLAEFQQPPLGANANRLGDEPVEPPSLIRSLINLLDNEADIEDEQKEHLRGELVRAERSWEDIKEQNRQALADLKRPQNPNPRQRRRPNFIMISADDLGLGDLASYGQSAVETPNIDRLALEGVRFTNYYAGSSVDVAGQCTLLTGQHTGHARLRGFEESTSLADENTTIAELLRPLGYSTAVVGDWSQGNIGSPGTPLGQGFTESFGYLDHALTSNPFPPYLWSGNDKIDLIGNLEGNRTQYVNDLFTSQALATIQQSGSRPFFMHIAYVNPFTVSEHLPRDLEIAATDWPQQQKDYATMLKRLDADVGKILDRLDKQGLDKWTYVLFTSDNGPILPAADAQPQLPSTGGLRGGKGSLYEGGLRVPMIVRAPGRVAAGITSDQVWAAWDVLPTVAALAGVRKFPDQIDGIAQYSLLRARGEQKKPEYLYWEIHEPQFAQALRMGDWKAVRPSPAAPLEIYNLKEDPREERDLASSLPALVADIKSRLHGARSDSDAWPIKQPL